MDIISHFNVKITTRDSNLLTRENYCTPSNKLYSYEKRLIKKIQYYHNNDPLYKEYWDFPNSTFEDENHYSKEYVESQYKDCMENFDLNMKFFESLNYNDFNKELQQFIKKYKFIEIFDLNKLSCSGTYIMVLDKYKQVYIGISENIKNRIIKHWHAKKQFDRLIFGTVTTSRLSIDSFGALDTTRIFYLQENSYRLLEDKYISNFNDKYILNRIAGGINNETDLELRNIEILSTRKKRNLKGENK